MADAKSKPQSPSPGAHASGGSHANAKAAPAAGASVRASRGWRDAWQLPALLLGGVLLALAVVHAMKRAPGPDFGGAIKQVEGLIEQGKYEDALALLNDPIGSHLNQANENEKRSFYVLSADALAYAQRAKGMNVKRNHEQVIELYTTARRDLHASLDARRQANMADSLIELGRSDEAMDELRNIPDSDGPRRRELLRRIVEHKIAQRAATGGGAAAADDEKLMDLLSKFRDDPAASGSDRAWAVAKQTRMRLDAGYADEALRRLLPEIQRLDSRLTPEAGELLVLLGRAYAELGDPAAAEEQLKLAEASLLESSPAYAESRVLLGRILQGRGKLEEAREQFLLVTARSAKGNASEEAWLGLGEVEADLGNDAASVAAYEKAVAAVSGTAAEKKPESKGRDARSKLVALLDASLGQRHRDLLLKSDFEHAMRYAELSAALYPADKAPPAVVLRVAETHHAAAEALIPPAARESGPDLSSLDPVTREEARRHYLEAGIAYSRHARMALISDPEASATSLWLAGDSFDNAGEVDKAIEAFTQYVDAKRDGPRRLLGEYRLARAWQSKGQFKRAIDLYETIVEGSPVSDEAYMSLVPLAQCYLLASDDKDAPKAEQRLLQIVEGKQFKPDAAQFRAAVVELGRMYRRIGNFPRAIERLSEAMTRYPELRQDAGMQSTLADSYRLSAAELGRQLKTAMPQNERQRLLELRQQRLL